MTVSAGALCWKQCCSRRRHIKDKEGELGAQGSRISEDFYPSPPSSQIRWRQSPSSSRSQTSRASKRSSSKSSKRKKPSNKQPQCFGEAREPEGDPGNTKCHGKGKGCPKLDANHGKRGIPEPRGNKRPLKAMATMARSAGWIAEARSRRKAKLISAATLAPNESKRRKVVEIMESCDIKLQGNGISCDELLTLAAVLGEAGIKSADQGEAHCHAVRGRGILVWCARKAAGHGEKGTEERQRPWGQGKGVQPWEHNPGGSNKNSLGIWLGCGVDARVRATSPPQGDRHTSELREEDGHAEHKEVEDGPRSSWC